MSRDKNGQFQAGNKIAKKRSKSKVIISNNAAEKKLPVEKKPTERLTDDFMPFGSDNLFPQRVTLLNRKSAVSRSIVNSKRNYIVGKGFESENEKFNNWKPNTKESLEDLTSKAVSDKLITGNAFIEVVRDRRNNIIQFYHKDATTCRVHKDGTHIIIHPDWTKYTSYKKLAKVIPLYPNFELIDNFERSIIHIKEYEQEFNYYGIPSNIASIDSANINYKTNKWNLSRLDNAFNTSGVMMLQADFSEEDAQTFEKEFNDKFTGEGKNGKPLMIVNEIGGEPNASKFIPVTQSEDGHWTDLHAQATQEIIIANQWFSGLSGLPTAQGLSSDNVLRNEYQIAISSIIPHEQDSFISVYERVLNEQLNFNLDDLSIINQSPISLVDLDNIHQAIIDINKEVSDQRMTEDMAKMTLKISFGLTTQQLEDLFV